ncbi:hypothetical protein HZH68_011559 [Vespula germanica]|uniref:Uncharacterized protein n=1 Tax=Vespula germanica TaxID=30212 RepID=A0A834JP02_VESGE|nr:hypothetical protein HZH68_011559 [Vespula germanica]
MVKNPRTVRIDPSKNSKAASHQHQRVLAAFSYSLQRGEVILSMDERGLATRNLKSSNFTGDLPLVVSSRQIQVFEADTNEKSRIEVFKNVGNVTSIVLIKMTAAEAAVAAATSKSIVHSKGGK